MRRIDDQTLLKMGKKHQKWLENTTVNRDAYRSNNTLYYLATYSNKFSSDIKACAILSEDGSKDEAMQSLLPHLSFSISHNNLLVGANERAKLDYSSWISIRDYLLDIMENNRIEVTHKQIYERAYQMMKAVYELQLELKQLWERVESITTIIQDRGYFLDEDVDFLVHAVIQANLIQYKQIKMQYDHCDEFDVIYEKRNKYRSYGKIYDVEMLKAMTSSAAKDDLETSLKSLSLNEKSSQYNERELYNRWLKTYKDQLDTRVAQTKKKLRYP